MKVTNKQRQDLIDLQTKFMAEHAEKYEAGVKEHRTDLFSDYDAKTMLKFIKEEVIDLVSYVYALERYLENEQRK